MLEANRKMWPKLRTLLLILSLAGLSLFAACSTATTQAPQPAATQTPTEEPCCNEVSLFLNCPEPQKELVADEIVSFYVTFTQELAESVQIEVSLETAAGATWKTALCYEDQCFMHNGLEKLVHEMASGPTMEFEIKMFVPETAQPGETKTVRMSTALQGNAEQAATIDLVGTMP